jgi:hypothetical protein
MRITRGPRGHSRAKLGLVRGRIDGERWIPAGTLGAVRTLFDIGGVGGLSDGQLLDRFLERQDEAAEAVFAALVARHGPMVLRACRGVLRDPHDAHGALQATSASSGCGTPHECFFAIRGHSGWRAWTSRVAATVR